MTSDTGRRGPAASLVLGVLVTGVLVGVLLGLWVLWIALVVYGAPVWLAWTVVVSVAVGVGVAADRVRRSAR